MIVDNTRVNTTNSVIEMAGLSVASSDEAGPAALQDVNWTVIPGDYWVIGGLHGSGKSALLSVAAGLMPPLQGSCRLLGREIAAHGEKSLADLLRVGLVFDGGQLFAGLTIEENVALPLRYHRELGKSALGEKVKKCLDLTGLTAQARQFPGNIGRAWRKRAGLARALALEPEVLLVDNPLGGLDSQHAHWWLETLEALWAGRRFFEGRPMTLALAAENLRPWRHRTAHLAVLRGRRFYALGRQTRLEDAQDPLVTDLMAEPLGAA